ncbi:MAG: methylaspartate mutase accessory protein GlmL [bacterium]
MSRALLVDFGSTYTKVLAVDLDKSRIAGRAYALTTAATDITEGLRRALAVLASECNLSLADFDYRLAASSAAGGLRMIAVGLVPELTAEAARQASLGAGARVIKVYSYELSDADIKEIGTLPRDLILLAGGTDGGDRNTILQNAKMLAKAPPDAPVIVAGNRTAAKEAAELLRAGGVEVLVTENVLPALRRLNIEPARETIRRVFMERIVAGKGFGRAEDYLGSILMPTPAAVLAAAQLLAEGTGSRSGLGELLIVDVGGATTDVHSVAGGEPAQPGTVVRGLPEPYTKRTVEGDLGLRVSALSLLETVGRRRLVGALRDENIDLEAAVAGLARDVGAVPRSTAAADLDRAMARLAVEIAVERHVGVLEKIAAPNGVFYVQTGKDLSGVRQVIGTGGIFAHDQDKAYILGGAVSDGTDPFRLKPREPDLLFDNDYLLWAMGLLRTVAPEPALAIMLRHLTTVQ